MLAFDTGPRNALIDDWYAGVRATRPDIDGASRPAGTASTAHAAIS